MCEHVHAHVCAMASMRKKKLKGLALPFHYMGSGYHQAGQQMPLPAELSTELQLVRENQTGNPKNLFMMQCIF